MYRKLAGEIIWAVNLFLRQVTLMGSYLQQLAPNVTVSGLINANRILSEIKHLNSMIEFKRINKNYVQ